MENLTTKQNNSFFPRNISNGTEEFVKGPVSEDLVNEAAFQATAALCLIIMVVGIPGNLLVIASVAFNKQLKTSPNILVLILSVGDVVLQSTIMPVHTFTYITGREPPKFICAPVAFVTACVSLTSVLNIGSIAIYRYYAVVLKNKYRRLTEKKVIVASCCFAFIFPLAQMTALLSTPWSYLVFDTENRSCHLKARYFASICLGFSLIFPMVAMIYCYVHICLVTRKSRSRVMAHNQTRGWVGNPVENKESRMSFMLAMVILVYFVTTVPIMLLKILVQAGFIVPAFAPRTVLSIMWMSTAINPFIYGLVNKKYRDAYRNFAKNVKTVMCACVDNGGVGQIYTIWRS